MDETLATATSNGRRAAVTGAGGFIGSHLVRHLVGRGWSVGAIVSPRADLTRLSTVIEQIETFSTDLAGDADLTGAFDGADVVFHLAAAGVGATGDSGVDVVRSNLVGTQRALEAATSSGVARFVYTGSCFEYPPGALWREDAQLAPATAYAATKAAGWTLAMAHARRTGLEVTGLRPFTVYGPGEAPTRLVPYAIGRALAGSDLQLSQGDQRRDWVYIDDVVLAFELAALSAAAKGEMCNVCTGRSSSVRDIVTAVLELTGSRSRAEFGQRPSRAVEFAELSGDPAKAALVLGFTADVSLAEGLRRTIESARR